MGLLLGKDIIAYSLQSPCPVVRTGTGFHAHATGRQVDKEFQQLAPLDGFFRTVLPWATVPCKLNVFLAKSIPMVARFMSDSSLKVID